MHICTYSIIGAYLGFRTYAGGLLFSYFWGLSWVGDHRTMPPNQLPHWSNIGVVLG